MSTNVLICDSVIDVEDAFLNSTLLVMLIFAIPLLLIIAVYTWWQRKKSNRALNQWQEAQQAGLTEPASLHPVIDPSKCLGCGSCVQACPEGDILGLVNRKAVLVAPTNCIGHGACKEACPADAITLVFGTETRGVEIPKLNPQFESTVPGLYIAGELGGMGLIKNAITQGQQAVKAVVQKLPKRLAHPYHLVIVGAGPAGLSAALAAQEKGIKYIVLEQDTIGGTVAHYPRGKVVMTRPASLPLVGKFQFREASKEALIEFWQSVVSKHELKIRAGTRVDAIKPNSGGFQVSAGGQHFETAAVLLAMGRRGTPRTLNVAGEELSKVVYRLTDPEQYEGKRVLVVGGGDSAIEAAVALAQRPNTDVTLCYRSDAFGRAKAKNREQIDVAVQAKKLQLFFNTEVDSITKDSVVLATSKGNVALANDIVIVCAGGILPTPFLKSIGIEVEQKFGTA